LTRIQRVSGQHSDADCTDAAAAAAAASALRGTLLDDFGLSMFEDPRAMRGARATVNLRMQS